MKNKKIGVLLIALGFFTIFIINKLGGNKMNYDNNTKYQDIISYKYKTEDLSKIMRNIEEYHKLNIPDGQKECIRQINDIKYLILLSENEEKLFVFLDKNNDVIDMYYRKKDFLEQSDFTNVQIGITRESDIKILDESPIYYDVSAVHVTGHIVKEGIIIITYDRFLDGEILNNPVVKSIDFYSNDKILLMMESDFFVSSTPYILPVDKD